MTTTTAIGPKTNGSFLTDNFVTRSVSYANNKAADFTIRLLATNKYTSPVAEFANRHRTITAILTLTGAALLFKKLCPASLSAKIAAGKDAVVRHLPISDANKARFLSGPSPRALSDVEKAEKAVVEAASEVEKAEAAKNAAGTALTEAEEKAHTVANRADDQRDDDLGTANQEVLAKQKEFYQARVNHVQALQNRNAAEEALKAAEAAQNARAEAARAAAAKKA